MTVLALVALAVAVALLIAAVVALLGARRHVRRADALLARAERLAALTLHVQAEARRRAKGAS